MNPDELRSQVASIRWWHSIDLGDGIVTPGLGDAPGVLRTLEMPEDLTGKSVLDIGAWDGFFSFESERRGAKRVLATDSFCWNGEGWGTKDGFELARRALGSGVEDLEIEVLDIGAEKVGTFDVVLFLGVLYHMRHPLLALERVYEVTEDLLILETEVDLIGSKRPVMVFYPGAELNGDPTNWWGPSPQAVGAMLRDVGFREVQLVTNPPPLLRRLGYGLSHRVKKGVPFSQKSRQGRVVFHAWR